jgi:hypothetical protein
LSFPAVASLVAEVSAAAEEAGEEIEGVVLLASAALLLLFQAFVAVLVVDFAVFFVGEGIVGFCYEHELVVCGLVVAVCLRQCLPFSSRPT